MVVARKRRHRVYPEVQVLLKERVGVGLQVVRLRRPSQRRLANRLQSRRVQGRPGVGKFVEEPVHLVQQIDPLVVIVYEDDFSPAECIKGPSFPHQLPPGIEQRARRPVLEPARSVVGPFVVHSQPVHPVNADSGGVRNLLDVPPRLFQQERGIGRIGAVGHDRVAPRVIRSAGTRLAPTQRSGRDPVRHIEDGPLQPAIEIVVRAFPPLGFRRMCAAVPDTVRAPRTR